MNYAIFSTGNMQQNTVFILSTFHQILKSLFCTVANLDEIRETEQSLSCETDVAVVAETNADRHTLLSFVIVSFNN